MFTWQIVSLADRVTLPNRQQLSKANYPTYHVNVHEQAKNYKTGGLPYLGMHRLPHLPGIPYFHLNKPWKFDVFGISNNKIARQ